MIKDFLKIGFGTWEFGGKSEPDPLNDDKKDIESIKRAIDSGISHIDTAEAYANGKCEELVGEAIKGYNREDLFIATKVREEKLGYEDVIKSCKESLNRLGLEYIDLFYIHYPSKVIEVKETAKALNYLSKEGLIKNIGLSNAKISTMEEYKKHLEYKIYASQCHYNLIAREPERTGLLNYCNENDINFIAWRPIQLAVPSMGIEPLYKKGIYEILDKLSEKYQKTNAEIAVRWLIQQEGVNIIFKSTNQKHIDEIVGTKDFSLTMEDMKDLKDNFPRQEDVSFTSSGFKPLG